MPIEQPHHSQNSLWQSPPQEAFAQEKKVNKNNKKGRVESAPFGRKQPTTCKSDSGRKSVTMRAFIFVGMVKKINSNDIFAIRVQAL